MTEEQKHLAAIDAAVELAKARGPAIRTWQEVCRRSVLATMNDADREPPADPWWDEPERGDMWQARLNHMSAIFGCLPVDTEPTAPALVPLTDEEAEAALKRIYNRYFGRPADANCGTTPQDLRKAIDDEGYALVKKP